MRKKLLMAGLLFTLIFTLNGCYSDDPQPSSSVAEVPNSSFSESTESINETVKTEPTDNCQDTVSDNTTQEETEYSKDIAETDTTTVSATTDIPKSHDTEKKNEPETKETVKENNQKPTEKNDMPVEEPDIETKKERNATKSDCKAVADRIVEYINSYRSTPATKLSGMTAYAEYRSRQLVSNFAHDTNDERAAATALRCGVYVDTALYGMEGEPYFEAPVREAIATAGYVGTVDAVAEKLALLVKNSSGHWAYVGSSDYSYIAVGVTYESGMWYCDIAMAKDNTYN